MSEPSQTGPWEAVDESWIRAETAAPFAEPRHPSTMPPQLPSARTQQVEAMLEMLTRGDYEGARIAADSVLRAEPTDDDALQCTEIAASELRRVYQARIGSLRQIPRPVRTRDGVARLISIRARGW